MNSRAANELAYIGVGMAAHMSYVAHDSIWLAIVHGALSWLYVGWCCVSATL